MFGGFIPSGVPLDSGTDAIIIAGSDAPQAIKNQANYTCSAANDDVIFNAAFNAYTTPRTFRAIGTFNCSQSLRMTTPGSILDGYQAAFPIPTSWAASLRALVQTGYNHAVGLTVNSSAPPTFSISSGGAGFLPGDCVFIVANSGATMPGGYSNAVPYYIVNYSYNGLGAASWQLSLTPNGAPLTGTGGGSGTISFSPATATFASNLLTVLGGASAPVFSSGQPVVITGGGNGSIPTPFEEFQPFYVVPQGSNTYKCYSSPSLKTQLTTGSSFAAGGFNIAPSQVGMRVRGLSITVPAGVPNTGVGWLKDNGASFGTVFEDCQIVSDPTVGGGSTTSSIIYLNGYGSQAVRPRIFGSNSIGVRCVGGNQSVIDGEIDGAWMGVYAAVTNSMTGATIANNHITGCQQNAILVATSVGAVIVGNKCDGNCTSGGTAEISISAGVTGTHIGVSNSFPNTLGGISQVSDAGTGTVWTASFIGATGGTIAAGGILEFSGTTSLSGISTPNGLIMNPYTQSLVDNALGVSVTCMQWGDDGDSSATIGFLGATPIARPAVTGSKGANAALTSLCTALASLGLITNSTS
ncbi:MAG TPA: hypothetical protein VGG44_04680 [Tepidisphaeraceae bacterium]|jgi:hypothetical protein